MKLCCFFNYAPLYRESIYKYIDNTFDTQYYFGREVSEGKKSGIAKLDYSIFKKPPIEFKNKIFLRYFAWRTKAWYLPFKEYDTFLITGDFVFSYIPLIVFCKLMGKRVYAWGHGLKTRKGKFRVFNDFFYRNISGFFSYGEGGKKRLQELGYDAKKVHVIYNSLTKRISPEDYSSNVYREHFGNDDPTLIFIGRLTPEKDIDWILKAAKEISSCNVMIVGDGQCRASLQDLASQLGIANRVWLYGANYNDELNKYFIYNADVCVSPGFVGLTALNALRFGTPVITHNSFEAQAPEYEVVEESKTGSLFEKGNFDDMCGKIKHWLEYAKGRREEIRQNCYDMINGKWNSDNQVEILKEILSGNGK